MPIDVQKALSAEMKPLENDYSERDAILYALSIGAGDPPTDKTQLKYTYENGLKVIPTFGVIPPFRSLMGVIGHPGLQFNPMMLLHGEQYLEIRRTPIPIRGKLINKPRIAAIYDKGKGAVVDLEVLTLNDKGEELFFNRFGVFLRGEGGFGGDSGPKPGNIPPEREPDKVVSMKTLPQQALLYRLNGDSNPLHADPQFAAMGGFERPILHGLCFFGFAGRAVLESFCDNDPAKFKSIQVRFSKHVFPGDTLITEMWKEGDDTVILRCKTAERGDDVITNAAVKLNV